MQIIYRLNGTSDELGREDYHGIAEILFPDVNYEKNAHAITITKVFSTQSHHRWLVKAVSHEANNRILIDLEPRESKEPEIYLAQTHKVKRSVISSLRKGTIVEVDYGYIPSVKKNCDKIRSNKRYPDTRQVGEMHKRRLAIVVKATGERVQVVPVSSSQPPAGDRSCFALESKSTEKLVHYNNPKIESFVICSMIETVSLNRILPPKAKPIKQTGRQEPQRSDGYPHKLSKNDLDALNKALCVTVGISDYHNLKEEVQRLYLTNNQLKRSKEAQEAELQQSLELLEEIGQIKLDNKAMYFCLEEMYQQIYSTEQKEAIHQKLDRAISDWVALLRDGD